MRHIWIVAVVSVLLTHCAPASKVTQEDLDRVNNNLAFKEQEMEALKKENEELRKEIEILKRAAYGNDPQAREELKHEDMRRLKEQQVSLHKRIDRLREENQELKDKLQGQGQRNNEKLPE